MTVSERLDHAEASYAQLTAQYAKTHFEGTDTATRLAALIRDEPITELTTGSQRLFFVRRSTSDAGISYRVFRTELSAIIGEEDIGHCEISRIASGICSIVDAEVARSYQRKGIASAMYDLIASDMTTAGGLLWPVSPAKMTDAEFKIWWRRSPALVFYYPHRDRLGLLPRSEFDALFDISPSTGVWEKSLAYCLMLLSRIRRTAGFIGLRL